MESKSNFLFQKKTAVLIVFLAATIIVASLFLYLTNFESPPENRYNADLVIKNAMILTLNKKSEIISGGWIAVNNGDIVGLGKEKNSFRARKEIDAGGKVVMPGLVNTHTHAAMTLLRGIDDSSKLQKWLANMKYYEDKLSENDVYWGDMLGEIEMIKSGTTTFNDMYFHEKSAAKSAKETGIRAVLDMPFNFQKGELTVDQKFIDENRNSPAIKLSLAPNPLLNFSVDNLKKISALAKENNFLVHIHAEEDASDRQKSLEKYGLSPYEILKSSGLLENKIILAHCVNFTDDEFRLLAAMPGAGVSLNPKSNFKLSGSTAPVSKTLDYGLILSLGTDGAASGNSLDLFDQMNFLAFTQRDCDTDKNYCGKGGAISPEKIVRMATSDGARVLGMENEIGSLETGKKADMIIVDFQKTGLVPSYNIYSSLVYDTDGSDVSDSIINGKIIMQNRRLVNLNEQEIVDKVNGIAKKIRELKNKKGLSD